ncbi:hypothetical protein NEOLEDRAFT_1148010 [Neolentinus lepideus HHB14362 ss-1]|uniref:Uncharacterized protein n=1 Tax=Neolentinus lepideus HHB14362 ss-1 TaxID=1314782 RepID=A0A165SM09_9AGAM|nr:hypothetical protein NEOLEDRAFT_1148010 [Neolentinus lepideus HHB14362 ss-1]
MHLECHQRRNRCAGSSEWRSVRGGTPLALASRDQESRSVVGRQRPSRSDWSPVRGKELNRVNIEDSEKCREQRISSPEDYLRFLRRGQSEKYAARKFATGLGSSVVEVQPGTRAMRLPGQYREERNYPHADGQSNIFLRPIGDYAVWMPAHVERGEVEVLRRIPNCLGELPDGKTAQSLRSVTDGLKLFVQELLWWKRVYFIERIFSCEADVILDVTNSACWSFKVVFNKQLEYSVPQWDRTVRSEHQL